jgi:hypothetical protein
MSPTEIQNTIYRLEARLDDALRDGDTDRVGYLDHMIRGLRGRLRRAL